MSHPLPQTRHQPHRRPEPGRRPARRARQAQLDDRDAREHRGDQQERHQDHHQVQERRDVELGRLEVAAPPASPWPNAWICRKNAWRPRPAPVSPQRRARRRGPDSPDERALPQRRAPHGRLDQGDSLRVSPCPGSAPRARPGKRRGWNRKGRDFVGRCSFQIPSFQSESEVSPDQNDNQQ